MLCTRILTNTRVPQMYKKLTSIMCQTPQTHTQLRSQVKSLRQCIVSQSSLHSLQMQLELLTLKIFSLMARYTPSPSTCQQDTTPNSEPHLRNSFIYSPLFSVVLYHLMIYNIACIFLCLVLVYCFKVYSNE